LFALERTEHCADLGDENEREEENEGEERATAKEFIRSSSRCSFFFCVLNRVFQIRKISLALYRIEEVEEEVISSKSSLVISWIDEMNKSVEHLVQIVRLKTTS